MSHPIGPQPPAAGPTRRPVTVAAAAALLVVMALAGLGNAVVGLLSLQGIVDRFRSGAEAAGVTRSEVQDLVAALRVGLAVTVVLALVVAVLLVSLAVGNLRASAGTRIVTWIVSALGVLCGGCGLAVLLGQRLVPVGSARWNGDVLRALTDAYPSWWLWVNGGLLAGQVLGYLLVALLLALPSANAFFRHRRPGSDRAPRWPEPASPYPSAPPTPQHGSSPTAHQPPPSDATER